MPVTVTEERSGLLRKYYEEAKYNAAFDRCVDVMVQLMQKYGNQVLKAQNQKISGFPNVAAEEKFNEHTFQNAA